MPHWPEEWKLGAYVARQSFASMGKEVSKDCFSDVHFSSAFQQRMFFSDVAGDGLNVIAASVSEHGAENSIVLVDLTDERLGFYQRSENEAITRLWEGMSVKAYDRLGDEWVHYAFGEPEHFQAFVEASRRVKDAFQRMGVWENTRLFAAQWSAIDNKGQALSERRGRSPEEWNEVHKPYYDFLAEEGWHLIYPDAVAVADTGHVWGLEPFHYTPDYYKAMVKGVVEPLG